VSEALKRLEALVGEWSMEAVFPAAGPTGVVGRTAFAWALDGAFLLQRGEVDDADAPNVLAVIAVDADGDGDGYTQHYFDSRGVVRTYAMGFDGNEWTLLRKEPDFTPLKFSQRFIATLEDGGDTIAGRWEAAQDGSTWELDFELTCRRIA
jgi:hypothetical protein